MYLWLILAFIFAAFEAVTVSKRFQKLEFVAKPAVMVFLFLWLHSNTGLQENTFWFGLGIVLSLTGDVLLMILQDRLFLFGLTAFLLAHIAYITGFREELVTVNAWSLISPVLITIVASRLLWQIVGALQIKGEHNLAGPVVIYGIVISIMLYVATATLYNPAWKTTAALLASLGALLFCTSDGILAWNKFVAPLKNGKVWTIMLYHLGQIGLVAGVISHFNVAAG